MKTDAQLTQDVIVELTWGPSVKASQVDVEVRNGTATLIGHVASYSEKWRAERAARRVSGLKGLAIQIDVHLPQRSTRADADIAAAARNALTWASYQPGDAVRVTVKDGWITLSGEVEWDYQREAARSAVRNLLGVVGVNDAITIARKLPGRI